MTNELEKNKEIQEDEISLKELILKIKEWWQYLWSKKWTIIIAGLIGGALGLAYSFIKKPVYTATTTFVLEGGEKSGGGLAAYAGVASMMGIDLGGGGGGIFQGDNIIELYKSKAMIKKALFSNVDSTSNKSLMEFYINMTGMSENWEKRPELNNINFTDGRSRSRESFKSQRLTDSIVGVIVETLGKECLSVSKPDKKLNIIQVDVKSNNEIFSKRFNEELVLQVNEFYVFTKTKKSLENVNILQHKADSVRGIMNSAIYSAVRISDETPNMNPTRQVQRAAPLQREQLSAETNKAILAEMVKNLEMGKIGLMKETPLIQVIDEPIYPLKKDEFGKAKGLVLGGLLFGVICVIGLILTEYMKKI